MNAAFAYVVFTVATVFIILYSVYLALIREEEEEEEEDYDEELIEPPTTGGKFHFQAPSMTGDFDFSESNPSFSRQETFPSMGRGRGRGQQMVPAWMTIHNNQN